MQLQALVTKCYKVSAGMKLGSKVVMKKYKSNKKLEVRNFATYKGSAGLVSLTAQEGLDRGITLIGNYFILYVKY